MVGELKKKMDVWGNGRAYGDKECGRIENEMSESPHVNTGIRHRTRDMGEYRE